MMKVGNHTIKTKIPSTPEEAQDLYSAKLPTIPEEEAMEKIIGSKKDQEMNINLAKKEMAADINQMKDDIEKILGYIKTEEHSDAVNKALLENDRKAYNDMLSSFVKMANDIVKPHTPVGPKKPMEQRPLKTTGEKGLGQTARLSTLAQGGDRGQ
jgi:hypothetical protein